MPAAYITQHLFPPTRGQMIGEEAARVTHNQAHPHLIFLDHLGHKASPADYQEKLGVFSRREFKAIKRTDYQ
jgi:hypothetical protein